MGLISIISLLLGGGIVAKDAFDKEVHIAEPNRNKSINSNNPVYFDGKNHIYIPTGEICYGRLTSTKSNIYPHLYEDRFVYEIRKNWKPARIVWITESSIEKDEKIQRERAIKEGKDIYYNRRAGVYRYLNDDKYYTYMGDNIVFVYDNEGKYIASKVLSNEEKDKVIGTIRAWES